MNSVDDKLLYEQYCLILEKDHRKTMVKFGIPEDVANYLHSFNDKYSIWFANQFKGRREFLQSRDKINWVRNQEHIMTGILDWVRNTPNTNLKQYDWDNAITAQEEYHSNLEVKNLEGEETYTIIKKYDDGFYWVDLETSNCPDEASTMGHCANTSAETMFSLRHYTPETQEIEAFVTIAANPNNGSWQQAKGKRNSKPKEEYHKYIADILIEYEMFEYESEYNAENDFGSQDFKDYIDEHREEYADPDGMIDKISANEVSADEFQAVINALEWKHINLNIEESYDGEQEIYLYGISYHVSLPISGFSNEKLAEEIVGYIDTQVGEDDQDMKEFIGNSFDRFNIGDYTNISVDSGGQSIQIFFDIRNDDSIFRMTKDGLDSFEYVVNDLHGDDDWYEVNDIIEEFEKFLLAYHLTSNLDKFVEEFNEEDIYKKFNNLDPKDPTIEDLDTTYKLSFKPFEIPYDKGYKGKTDLKQIKSIGSDYPRSASNVRELLEDNNPLYYVNKYLTEHVLKFFTKNNVSVEHNKNIIEIVLEYDKDDRDTLSDDYSIYLKELKEFDAAYPKILDGFNKMLKELFFPVLNHSVYVDITDKFKLKVEKHPSVPTYRNITVSNSVADEYWTTSLPYSHIAGKSEEEAIATIVKQSNIPSYVIRFPEFKEEYLDEYLDITPVEEDPRQTKLNLDSKRHRFSKIFYT